MAIHKNIRTSASEGVPVVFLTSSKFIDRELIQQTQQELIAFIQSTKPARLVINFKDVEAISSEFITTMLRCSDYVQSENGELRLCNMTPMVRMAFQVTNLDGTLLHIMDSTPKAILSFKKKSNRIGIAAVMPNRCKLDDYPFL
ncbi:anti-anti-sigma regulatory factor (antagonist of anti-sigma factor) [Rhodopirellula maiorica SM1]|uniref:Anti-anti-sigma regulatory factor (Antagonist of anti-sigma factor) n=1 Tax=Rhodopirellula maiorica SM1 TaxID=1265738 RepID=M5RX49_9BACT|nr:STAS domain-containing protein [Rhodopirellula maiorica]EMI18524.1 anti-anti-sigma regulatory factor (antagonist of anti-sigma factor) [Rhodopirellula maiorica SM1]